MAVWVPGFPRDENVNGRGGGSYSGGPWKFLWHSTEGGWDGSMSVFRNNLTAPHVMAAPPSHPDGPRIVQMIPLDRSAYSLKNNSGGAETNRDQVLQVEIVGTAAGTIPDLTDADLEWLGREVLAPMNKAIGGHINVDRYPQFKPYPASYGTGNGVRFSSSYWDSFDGQCGHQHAPEGNVHGDPGLLNVGKIAEAAKARKQMTPAAKAKIVALAKEAAKGRRMLRVKFPPMRGRDVKELQTVLHRATWRPYGPGTRDAVEDFQEFFGLTVTGKVDRKTWEAVLFFYIARGFGY